jgi:membrane protease YdiL (CAAX protease family)
MTMLTTTYPLTRAESQLPSVTTTNSWGFWATLGWFGVALTTYVAVGFLCGLVYVIWSVLTHPDVALTFESPTLGYLSAAIGMPAAALVLMLAARRRGSAFGYIGFALPQWRHVLIGFASLVALWGFWFGVFKLFPAYDQAPELIREYRGILGNPTAVAASWLLAVVTAPVAEEIIFRGFIMRGWSTSRLGMIGAIVLSSAAFAVVHLQYNPLTMLMVFTLGLHFGVMRWRSGSTTLPIMLHMAWNLAASVYFAWQASMA